MDLELSNLMTSMMDQRWQIKYLGMKEMKSYVLSASSRCDILTIKMGGIQIEKNVAKNGAIEDATR